MARCSAVWPNEPSAFITSASVFHSFVFSSSLKSWSTVVGLVPSNRTRTFSFFFTLQIFCCHSERSEAATQRTKSARPAFSLRSSFGVFKTISEMFRFAQHDRKPLFRPFEFTGEKIIHHQCCDESGDTKILLRIVIQHMQSKFITSPGKPRQKLVHREFLFICPLANRVQ